MDGLASKEKCVYYQHQQHNVPTAANVSEQAAKITSADLDGGTPAAPMTSLIMTTTTTTTTSPSQTKSQSNTHAENDERIRVHHMIMHDATPYGGMQIITQAANAGAGGASGAIVINPVINVNSPQTVGIGNINTAGQWLQIKLADIQLQQQQQQEQQSQPQPQLLKSPVGMAAHCYSLQTQQQQRYNSNNNSATLSSNNNINNNSNNNNNNNNNSNNNNNNNNKNNNSNYILKHYKNISLEQLAGLNAKVKMRNKNEEAINDLLERIPDIERTFDVLSRIGNGTFSTVLLATLKKERSLPEAMRRKFAIKHHIPTSHPDRIMKELQCMTKMGGTDNVVGINCCIRCDASVAFIMPYMAHDRFHDFYTKMKPDEVKFYMRNLLLALRHVHRFDIIHRDVKPSNFLYNRRNRQFLLVDFGLAQHVPTPAADIIAARVAQMQQPQPIASNSEQRAVDTPAKSAHASQKRYREQNEQQQQQLPMSMITSLDTAGAAKRLRLNDSGEAVAVPMATTTSTITSTTQAKITTATDGAAYATQMQIGKMSETPAAQPGPVTHDGKLSAANAPPAVGVDAPTINEPTVGSKYNTNRNNNNNSNSSNNNNNNANNNNNNNNNNNSNNKCYCYGHPHVCNVCLIKKEVHASRAGTPGYRPPEVLLKYPDQTTAVDVWAAGVIFLSVLSSVYPFFKAPSDYIALAEIVTIFGDKTIRKTAFNLDRLVTLSQRAQPLDLHKLCVRFRNRLLFSATEMLQKHQQPDGSCDVCKNCDQYYFNCLCLESQYNTEPVNAYDIFPPSAYDLLLRLLEVNPHKRITAEEALKHPFLSEPNEPNLATISQQTPTIMAAASIGDRSCKRPRASSKAKANNFEPNAGDLVDANCDPIGDAVPKRQCQ